ncbi:COX15/CtaA family protein [Sphingomonas sp. AX6]|uniref:COX15/CtaA family protein n=1 Tax=Sphingomonas sp. AX6 TaxID=2653171 RepID=UPI0012EFEF04|nr:COX15/CtaA family protein [Sphingomonas sp. AX6]VXC74448.1 Heme A synthase [Sphingomonas sp. AX6]
MDQVEPRARIGAPRAIANWLFFVACLVVAIVAVGGITRLTESGLSITEWKPVSGVLPPLNEAQWLIEFEKYKQIPEYQQVNRGMSLDEFKFIFFWEYIHRVIARLIGVAFALPLAWFWVKGMIPSGFKPRLVGLFLLGGLQGVIGWWMVASGLAERTDVSHFRLAAHLLLALFVLASLLWTARDMLNLARDPAAPRARLTPFTLTVGAILFVQLLFGAFVAGLNAGLVTDQWPMMNGRFFPTEEFAMRSFWDAIVNDPYVLHWIHRWWAWVAFAALLMLAIRVKRSGERSTSIAIHALLGIQILLGIATVLSGVDIVLAVLHQVVGALLVGAVTWGAHRLGTQAVAAPMSHRVPA